MENKDYSSFRDPAGYIYYKNNKVFRRINNCYFKEYNYFISSGLYKELVSNGLLVEHKEIYRCNDYIDIEVFKIPFISYPYEWCFNQLKDAALLTLKIQIIALKYNMCLKDASCYNIQFYNGKPIFIDTLSFEMYREDEPWGAYGQFCRHFMAPLLLMKYVDDRANCLLKNFIDGIPIDFASNILKNRGGFVARQHIKWHSKSILRNNNINTSVKVKFSKKSMVNMINMIIRQTKSLQKRKIKSEWDDYYNNTNYNEISDKSKIAIVKEYLRKMKITTNDILWDLGANDGKYSNIASNYFSNVVAFDVDVNVVNRYYNNIKDNNNNIVPLILDVTNPSPSIGFASCERLGINERGPVRCVMALALIHHIAISNNVPFDKMALWFASLGKSLIIEFVPKDDSQVKKLLLNRNDIFNNYNKKEFESVFSKYFCIKSKKQVKDSKRIIYYMEVKKKNEK